MTSFGISSVLQPEVCSQAVLVGFLMAGAERQVCMPCTGSTDRGGANRHEQAGSAPDFDLSSWELFSSAIRLPGIQLAQLLSQDGFIHDRSYEFVRELERRGKLLLVLEELLEAQIASSSAFLLASGRYSACVLAF